MFEAVYENERTEELGVGWPGRSAYPAVGGVVQGSGTEGAGYTEERRRSKLPAGQATRGTCVPQRERKRRLGDSR